MELARRNLGSRTELGEAEVELLPGQPQRYSALLCLFLYQSEPNRVGPDQYSVTLLAANLTGNTSLSLSLTNRLGAVERVISLWEEKPVAPPRPGRHQVK